MAVFYGPVLQKVCCFLICAYLCVCVCCIKQNYVSRGDGGYGGWGPWLRTTALETGQKFWQVEMFFLQYLYTSQGEGIP